MITKLFLLNSLLFVSSLVGVHVNSSHFLTFMISVEIMYLSIICSFCTVGFIIPFDLGLIYGLFCMSLAAIEAVIGFFLAVGIFAERQSLFLV
jgi:NADH:ubiquinone oxidoreductase subunit K